MKKQRMDWWLIAIIGLAAFLYFYNIGNAGSNEYYTATAKSMTANWKAFFFASLDPAGFITVDKPPVALWFQALSVALFGASDWSVLLPEALAGVLSTWLLYFIVKPFFGRVAARWASFIFACTPIFVAVTRTNNLDTMLIFTLLVATWALIKSIHTKKATWLLVSFALVGVGFNMKMMQAYMVLPAFYLFYWLAKNEVWKRKLKQLTIATVLLLITSLSYAAIADLMPKDKRPYIGSSQTNSVLELALGYNGIGRLTGSAGPGGNRMMDAQTGGEMPQLPNGANMGQLPNGTSSMGQSPNGENTPPQLPEWKGGQLGGIGIGETGNRGVLRLFNQQLSGQISWLLPFVLFSTMAVILSVRKQRAFTLSHKAAVFWLAWLVPMMGFFSIAGFFHRYYLSMMAPAIAALVAIGSVLLWEFYKEGKQQWLLPTAFLATFSLEAYILYQNKASISTVWILFVGLLGLASFVLLLAFRQNARIAYYVKVASLFGLLLMPFYWALTPILYGGNSMIPAAGPQLTDQQGGRMMGTIGRNEANDKLIQYLEKNYNGETYLVATFRATEAAQIMLKTDKAVMAMGGFSGNDPVLTTEKLEKLVKNGEVKYFLVSGFGGGQSNNEIVQWIQTHCKEVAQTEWKQSNDAQPSFG